MAVHERGFCTEKWTRQLFFRSGSPQTRTLSGLFFLPVSAEFQHKENLTEILENLPTYVSRTIEPIVQSASEEFPVLMVTGARHVLKTIFIMHLNKGDREYVTLDDPGTRELAKKDPGLFFQRFAPPILIDEIPYAPELFPSR